MSSGQIKKKKRTMKLGGGVYCIQRKISKEEGTDKKRWTEEPRDAKKVKKQKGLNVNE